MSYMATLLAYLRWRKDVTSCANLAQPPGCDCCSYLQHLPSCLILALALLPFLPLIRTHSSGPIHSLYLSVSRFPCRHTF